jgi:hypothetical protein
MTSSIPEWRSTMICNDGVPRTSDDTQVRAVSPNSHVNSQMTVSESRCTKNTRQATSVSKCKKVRLNSTGMHEYRCAQKGRTLCCQGHHSPRCIPKETFPEFNQSLYTRSKSVNGNLQQLFTAKQHPCHFYPFAFCA